VAEEDEHIVGFANYGRELENDPDYRGELYALYILKQFQGKGGGSALLQRAALDLLVLGISSMLVWVLSENPHRKFYERLGGVYLREKPIEFGNKTLQVSAYGWRDIRHVAG
jgi:GNAT superfamily N-acetyltransferase